jgi:hypothetical protein
MASLLALCIGLEVLIGIVYYVKYVVPRYTFKRIRYEEKKGALGVGNSSAEYYEVYRDDRRISCLDMLDELGRSSFVEAVTEFLGKRNPFSKGEFYYLLFTPFQNNFLSRPFTLVVLKDGSLGATLYKPSAVGDVSKYNNHLKQCTPSKYYMSFRSRQGDTFLITPCPSQDPNRKYGFIGSYLETSTPKERLALFQELQLEVLLFLETEQGNAGAPMFISTHGLDVPWLHFRLETPLPKHYTDQKEWYDKLP